MGNGNSQGVSKENYEKVQQLIKERSSEEGAIVQINVGGKIFTTLKMTIEKSKSSYMYHLVNSKQTLKDRNGNTFIDRPSEEFSIILDGLRTGVILLPENNSQIESLFEEIEYYGLKDVFKDQLYRGRFIGTTLLTNNEVHQLNKWLKNTTKDWKLLYKGTKDGFKANTFHMKCKGKSNTIVLM